MYFLVVGFLTMFFHTFMFPSWIPGIWTDVEISKPLHLTRKLSSVRYPWLPGMVAFDFYYLYTIIMTMYAMSHVWFAE